MTDFEGNEVILPVMTPEKIKYARSWAVNALNLAEQGCYQWMADQLKDLRPNHVLDVGCGTGEGVAALYRAYHSRIIALDENGDCIRITADRLHNSGIDMPEVAELMRLGYSEYADGTHDLVLPVNEPAIRMTPPITLVHSDVLAYDQDEVLRKFLEQEAPFDAVTVWLAGTWRGRETCRSVKGSGINTSELYRLAVQNECYRIAGKFLRKDGWLQVVDRAHRIPSKNIELETDLLRCHREQAEGTGLEVFSWNQTTYREVEGAGIRVVTDDTLGAKEISEWAVLSVLS